MRKALHLVLLSLTFAPLSCIDRGQTRPFIDPPLSTEHLDTVCQPVYVNFPIGEFPVQVAIAKQNGDERVAFSRILFSAAPVAKWEMARNAEQAPLPVFDTLATGWGDGRYASYIGWDSSGRPCQLLTDFEMFDWMDER